MRTLRVLSCALLVLCTLSFLQTANQPKVAPGPDEPNWWDILRDVYGLDMFTDLANPVETTAIEAAGLFRKAGPGLVVFEPVIALGTVNSTHGGWYPRTAGSDPPLKRELWAYADKNTANEIVSRRIRKPSLNPGSRIEFDPGDQPFGLWVLNDSFEGDFGVFSEPSLVARFNSRLAAQPYKVMIYALPDQAATYLIGWEYSTNDDFQDAVCVIRNAELER
jgi:hypothetical protein